MTSSFQRRLASAALALIATGTLLNTTFAQEAVSEAGSTSDGIWASRGYGWLWRISGGRIDAFDIGDGFCIPKSSFADDTGSAYSWAELSEDRQVLRLRLQDPDYIYTFDRMAELPATCRKPATATPAFVFDVTVKLFNAHYAFFDERGVNWNRIVETARSKLRPVMNDAELLEVLAELLAPLRDSHVYIEAEIEGEDVSIWGSGDRPLTRTDGRPAITGEWNPRAAIKSLTSVRDRGDHTLLYGKFADDIGYLQVTSMSGMKTEKLEVALDDAMMVFSGARAVIVDVSQNGGGLDSFARRIARRFAVVPTVAYTKHAGDYIGAPPQEIVLQPSDRPSFVGPVYLITGPETASAAEVFVLAMRALPNVVHVGQATDGSLSDELWKTLPNSWILSLSNEVYLDSQGFLWEGRGIEPEIHMEVSEDRRVSREDQRSVQSVLELIEAQRDMNR
jgi:carboxyl-terminal processing protease